jgi:hypothetical protein
MIPGPRPPWWALVRLGLWWLFPVVILPGSPVRTLTSVEDHTATRIDARPAPALRRYVGSYVGFDLRGFPAGVHCGPPGRVLTAVISLSDPLEVAAGMP